MSRFISGFCVLALLLTACGQSTPDQETSQNEEPTTPAVTGTTAFGSVADVEAYLQWIGPHVQKISQLQTVYESGLASAKDGIADRRGTGRNLAARAKEAQPELQELLRSFDAQQPPALLAPFHRDVRKLITLRIDAYNQTIAGWAAEEAGTGGHEKIYSEVESTLAQANQLIQSLIEQQMQIDSARPSAAPAATP